jgi:hypothetical protein
VGQVAGKKKPGGWQPAGRFRTSTKDPDDKKEITRCGRIFKQRGGGMANPWFRLYSEAVDDEKLRLLAFEDRWHYVAILCCKCQGILESENKDLMWRKVAVKLGVHVEDLKEIAARLMDVGLVDENLNPSMHLVAENLRLPAHEWAPLREQVFYRDDYTCQYCGKRGVRLECDHVVPVSRGGHNGIDNLATACAKCNRSKSAKTLEEWCSHG